MKPIGFQMKKQRGGRYYIVVFFQNQPPITIYMNVPTQKTYER